MTAPRRWIDDPEADETLRQVLRGTPRARSLDPVTRRRLGAKVVRASALPAVAAGWLFVKSAAAALGVVLGAGALAVSTGVVEWSPRSELSPARHAALPAALPRASSALPLVAPVPSAEAEAVRDDSRPLLNPTPALPVGSPTASAGGTLSVETALLEQARGQMRAAPSVALALAAEHAARFPRGQLTAERTLIQIEALHRLSRDVEARRLARGLLDGAASGLYVERVHQLLGTDLEP